MRGLLSIFLIVILYLPFWGLKYYFQQEIKTIRKEVKWMIAHETPEEDLVHFTFSQEQSKKLNWKHDHEFEYNGQMYDIIRRNETKDSVTFVCWWDKAETELNHKLNTLCSVSFGKKTEKDPEKKHLFSYSKDLNYLTTDVLQFNRVLFPLEKQFSFSFTKFIRRITNKPPTPPPISNL